MTLALVATTALVVVIAGAIGFVFWFIATWPLSRVRRAMAKLPRRRAAELVEGDYVVVSGIAECESLLTSPSGRPCVVFATRMMSKDENAGTLGAVSSAADFVLVDGDARVRVAPGAFLDAELATTGSVDLLKPPPVGNHGAPAFGASIVARNIASANVDRRAREGIVTPGQRIALAGLVVKGKDGALSITSDPTRTLLLTDRGSLVLPE